MKNKMRPVELWPIGQVETKAREIPRHWSISEAEGQLVIHTRYLDGLKDIKPGQRIAVIFLFHRSPDFSAADLLQTPPHGNHEMGIFSICSPLRPNPLGLSVLEVIEVRDNRIRIRGLDMLDGTPILDIKPHIE